MDIPLPYRIFAVDPATTKSGWSVLDVVCFSPLEIHIVDHAQIDGEKLLAGKKEKVGIFGRQLCILDALEMEYEELITKYQPDAVVSESAYGFSHMSALIALTLAINVLKRVTMRLLGKAVYDVPPTITKKAFTGSGGADKDIMRLAYQTNKYLSGIVADALITEHEIDSIGHGVGHIMRDILKTIIQVSALDAKRLKREKAKAREEAAKAKLITISDKK